MVVSRTCSFVCPVRSTHGIAEERANSFVGTAQYVSPELLERNETSKR